MLGVGFRVLGLGFRVQDLEFEVESLWVLKVVRVRIARFGHSGSGL